MDLPLLMQQAAQQPQSRSDLNTLIARRDALREQLESITERRGELASQRLNAEARAKTGLGGTQDRDMARELETRINELGARSRSIEAQLDQVEDAITAARSSGAGQNEGMFPRVPTPVIAVPPIMDPMRDARVRHDYERMMFAEGAILVLLAVVGMRIVWVAAKRRFSRGIDIVPGMTELRQAVDTIAVEVERISENQRYVTRMLTERAPAAAEPVETRAKEPTKRI